MTHVIGFDDAPFRRGDAGPVTVVGAAFAGGRLDGVLHARVTPDGDDATAAIAAAVRASPFHAHGHAVMLQGIAVAGFNVIDVPALHRELERPVLVVARREPRYPRLRRALLTHFADGAERWARIAALPAMAPVHGVWAQWMGVDEAGAAALVARFQIHGRIPEPLRTAHLIAGGLSPQPTRQRV